MQDDQEHALFSQEQMTSMTASGEHGAVMTENAQDTPASGLEQSPSHLLHRAQQWASERFSVLFGDKEITLRQYAVLAAVSDKAGRSQTDLVRATGIDRSTLADMIKRMEHKGLLAREKSAKDGRAKAVKLTHKGRAKLEEARPFADAADRTLLDALPKARRRAFVETLEMLAAAANAAEEAEVEARQQKKLEKKAFKKAKGGKKEGKAKPRKLKAAVTELDKQDLDKKEPRRKSKLQP
jgi:MarR family transcriptional regulator, temperature-dependent positive regulator of motility